MSSLKKRKLRAILFADIVGYTALMQKDEAQASLLLQKFRTTLNEKVTLHAGEIINNYGDGCLCTFESAVDAMTCAKEVQLIFQEAPKVPVRIGLHSGDVFFENDNVFGDSVNIASRIESLGVAGAVLFSKQIKRHIANQTEFEVQSLGEFHFKNVEKDMEVFGLANEGLVIPKPTEMQGKGQLIATTPKGIVQWIKLAGIVLALLIVGGGIWNVFMVGDTFKVSPTMNSTDKSIAVLPFENFNKDPEQQYFSDGISQDILTHLSGIKDLTVISFNSSKLYRDSKKSSKEIGTALGVQHLLSGSVQQSGDNLRIRAMLVNAKTDQQIWAKGFNKKLNDIFQIQSEVSAEIAEVLKAELLPAVATRINEKPTENIEAWQEFSQGRYFWNLRGTKNLQTAEQHFLNAIKIDSTFALAYAGVAKVNSILGAGRYHQDGMGDKLIKYAEKAIALNPNTADALAALGTYHRFYKCNFSKSIQLLKKAITLEPGNSDIRQWLALTYLYKGDIEKARKEQKIAQRLDPSSRIILLMGNIILMTEGNYEEAIIKLEQFYEETPTIAPIPFLLSYFYTRTGAFDKVIPFLEGDFSKRTALALYSEQQDFEAIKAMKATILEKYHQFDRERILYLIDNELMLGTGNLEKYISRLDTGIFVLGYDDVMRMQMIPPPDSIRLHPRFQEMMQKRGFTVRPKSAQLKAIKKEL